MELQSKAAFLIKNGPAHEAFRWESYDPGQPAKGQVLVEVEAFGLNFADVLARNGLYREAPPLPAVLGYDIVGRVIGIGEGVDSTWLGKRIVALTRFGGYATHLCTPIIGAAVVPEEMPDYVACALGTQYATAYYAAHYIQNVRPNEKVLVHAAAGGVGTALVQLLQNLNCTIYATAGSEEKVKSLKERGVMAYNYNVVDYEIEILQALNGDSLDVSFNSIAGATFKKDMRLLGSNGRMILYGFAERSGKSGGKWATLSLLWKMGITLPILLLAKSKSIIGVNMLKIADYKPYIIQTCLEELVKLWSQGKIAPIHGGTYAMEELPKAHEALENRKTTGKVIVKVR